MVRSLQANIDSYQQCEMVRYRGGRRWSSQESGAARRRSRSRDRSRGGGRQYKYSDSYCTPVSANYLNSPMFDSLHHHKAYKSTATTNTISLLQHRPGHSKHKYFEPINIISQCKVL